MEHVSLQVEDGVATIRIDRPKMNALNRAVQEEIRAAAQEASARDDVRAVLYGGEKVFAAGADIKEMADLSYTDMVTRSAELQSAFDAVATIPKPVVAAVTGYALGGGCELALCADIRIVGQGATLGQPEILLGIIPGAGGTQRLTRLVGPSRAKDIIFTGRFVKADEAAAIGLVDQVVPDDQVYETALTWARRFTGAAPYALRAAKLAIDRGLEVDLDTGLEIERAQFAALFATEDQRIGMRSFIENGPGKAAFEGSLSVRAARSGLATLVWLVAVVLALVLAVAALLIALRADRDQRVVRMVLEAAGRLDLGTVHVFRGSDALLRDHLVSWGVVAVEYLVVGKVLDWAIRPRVPRGFYARVTFRHDVGSGAVVARGAP